jgi:predicted dehydrogenase
LRIGFVGCGYVADTYIRDLKHYPDLELAAVTDSDPERTSAFGAFHSIKTCPTVETLLEEPGIELIVNVSDVNSHYKVTKQCLEAGRHVYSDKPIGVSFSESKELAEMAEQKGLYLSSAPCNILGETAQTLWRALRNGAIGKPRLVFAEYDDGPLHLQEPQTWFSVSGAPYPYRDIFRTGFTMMHAAYHLSLFAAVFGPASTITAFSSCFWPDKTVDPVEPMQVDTPDASVASIAFESGPVVRFTCGILGPHNHSLSIIGDTGILKVEEVINYSAPVYVDTYSRFKFRAQRYSIADRYPIVKAWFDPNYKVYPPVKNFSWKKKNSRHRQDFARGVAELARAITQNRPSRLPLDFCLHVNELVWAMQNIKHSPYKVTTTFKPLEPLDDEALKEFTSIDW